MKTLFSLAVLLGVGFSAGIPAQQVYRCELADGSTTFSDLPCESDIGEEGLVDATPHQGHRPSPNPGRPAYEMPEETGASDRGGDSRDRSGPANYWEADSLSRSERMSLERERKSLLSELKRRHVDPGERRAMISDLRKADEKLGLGPEDVPDMPAHDRDVYKEHNIYPGEFEVIRYQHDDAYR